MPLWAVPMELKEANEYVTQIHRHHQPVHRDKFRIGCADENGIHGVVQVGRPVNRNLDDGLTLEVVRLCTDGTRNACSFLYSRAARIAKEMGYKKIITYILQSEEGTSLKASGWTFDGETRGGSWDTPSRRRTVIDGQMTLFGSVEKYPTEKKQRWIKRL